jgi:hypothetical protein
MPYIEHLHQASNCGYVVSGTLTPDATGNYEYTGTHNAYPYYTREDGAYVLFKRDVADHYVISDGLDQIEDCWENESVVPSTGNYGTVGETAGTATVAAWIRANVYTSAYASREAAVKLTDTGHLGLYTGECATMEAGDIVQIEDTSNGVFVGGYVYESTNMSAIKTVVDAVLEDTGTTLNDMILTIAADTAGMDGMTPPTANEIKTALEADGGKLDHLWEMTEDDGGTRRLTENALEEAPSGTGASAATIADAVWDEATSGHTTEGTFGEQCKTDIDAILTDADAILVDTGTTLSDAIAVIDANVDQIETAVVTDIPASLTTIDDEIAVINANVNQIETAVITDIPTSIAALPTDADVKTQCDVSIAAAALATAANLATVDTNVDSILADTNEMQGKLPTNKIMGSSDVNDHDTDINSILADTNELQTDDYPTTLAAIQAKTDQLEFTSLTVNANLAGGSIGTGSSTVSYYVYTNEEAKTGAIANVAVWVSTDESGDTVVASGVTDSDGLVTFYLDPATYYFWRSKSGYSFTNPDTEVIE